MNETLRAIGLMTCAMAAFALADMSIAIVSDRLPTSQLLCALGAGGAILFGTLVKLGGGRLVTPLWRAPGVLARNIAEIVGTIGIMSALALIPFSQASAVMQAAPLVVTLGAALLLKEHVGPRRWSVILVGLVGVLIIIAPDPGDPVTLGTVMAVVGMVGLSCRDLATRFVPKGASTLELAFLSMIASLVASALLSAVTRQAWLWPTAFEAALMAVMILAAGIAYFCVTSAMRMGHVSAVAPFRYTRIVFAFLLAVLVLGESLGPRTLVGTALIVAAGLYTLLRERRLALSGTQPARPR